MWQVSARTPGATTPARPAHWGAGLFRPIEGLDGARLTGPSAAARGKRASDGGKSHEACRVHRLAGGAGAGRDPGLGGVRRQGPHAADPGHRHRAGPVGQGRDHAGQDGHLGLHSDQRFAPSGGDAGRSGVVREPVARESVDERSHGARRPEGRHRLHPRRRHQLHARRAPLERDRIHCSVSRGGRLRARSAERRPRRAHERGPRGMRIAVLRRGAAVLAFAAAVAVLLGAATAARADDPVVPAVPVWKLSTYLSPGWDRSFKCDLVEEMSSAPRVVVFGGSRALRMDPGTIRKLTGLRAFNAAFHNGKPEDAWAFTNWLLSRKPDQPPNVIWCVQATTFADVPMAAGLILDQRLSQWFPPELIAAETARATSEPEHDLLHG